MDPAGQSVESTHSAPGVTHCWNEHTSLAPQHASLTPCSPQGEAQHSPAQHGVSVPRDIGLCFVGDQR